MACVREKRNVYRVVVGKAEKKGLLRRPWSKWDGTVEIDLKECGGCGQD
jgi:hypothetical protein